jgi:hypothetical protein
MRKEEFQAFTVYLTGVAETFGQKLNAEQIMLYFEVLQDEFENIEAFKKAAKKLLKSWNYSYMPKPAHFIEAKKEFSRESIEIIAQKAWDSVIEAIKEGVGYTATAEFEDNLIPAVVELCGGFERLATKTFEELEWIKKEFLRTYKAAIEGEIKLQIKEPIALLESPKVLRITADYPVNSQNYVAIENKQEQNKTARLIANLTQKVRV